MHVVKTVAAVFILLVLSTAQARSAASDDPFDDLRRSLGGDAQTFEHALVLYGATDDPGPALAVLDPLLKNAQLPWRARVIAASLMARSGDFAGASGQYRAALDSVGAGWRDIEVDLAWRLGHALLKAGQADAAIPVLLQDIQFPGNTDNAALYEALWQGLLDTERVGDAACVAAYLQLLDPLDQHYWSRHGNLIELCSKGGSTSAALPSVPQPVYDLVESIGAIAVMDDAKALRASNALAAAAAALSGGPLADIARRYRQEVSDIFYLREANSGEPIADNQLAAIGKVKRGPQYAQASVEVQALGDLLEAQIDVSQRLALQALSCLQAYYHKIDPKTAAPTGELRRQARWAAYYGVSFDESGAPRSPDPDRFLDPSELVPALKGINHNKGDGSRSRLDKYSSVSRSEDLADTYQILLIRGDIPDFERKIRDLLELRIRQRKFEVPVKLALVPGARSILEIATSDGQSTLGQRLDAEIRRSGPPAVSDTTLNAYAVSVRLHELAALARADDQED